MTHFSVEQYKEVMNRYLPLEEQALAKGLRLNFNITLYGNNDPGDVATIRITKWNDNDSLFFKTISEAHNTDTEDEKILGEGYYRSCFYHYVGLLAAFDDAEKFINEYKKEA